MYPGTFAATHPDRPAVIMAETGEGLTYRELEDGSVRLARTLLDHGLRRGDVVALLSDNHPRVFEVYWAAQRAGLLVTAVNHHLSPDEAAYIVDDCGARALVVSAAKDELATAIVDATPGVTLRLAFGGTVAGHRDYEEVVGAQSPEPLADQPRGGDMLYSSGTTGRPKGIKPNLVERQIDEPGDLYIAVFKPMYGFDEDTVYLSPAPVYHAAPLRFGATIQSTGGTVVMMHRFDPEQALAAIERYRVTHSQWVPTMFVRMLKLPDETKQRYDVSSLRVAIHAAAPCPVEVKQAMLDWWGPVLYEYYSSSEANGITFINPQQWLERPGSVGVAGLGTIHVCDDDGRELATERGRHRLLRARPRPVRLPQRPGQDPGRAAPRARDVDDHRRPGLRRRRRLPLPHRPQELHDHLRRREHLPAGDRGRPDAARRGLRRRGDRRAGRRDGRVGVRRRPARARHRAVRGARRGAPRARARPHRALQDAPAPGVHRRPAAHADGQAREAPPARAVRGGRVRAAES